MESPVAQWLEHPTRSWMVVASNPIWNSDFFRVDVSTLKISTLKFPYNNYCQLREKGNHDRDPRKLDSVLTGLQDVNVTLAHYH